MANVTVRVFDAKAQTAYDELLYDNGDGTYSRTGGTATAANQTDSSQRSGPAVGSLTNRSSTITLGGTAQQAAAANTSRKFFALENPADPVAHPTYDLWYSWTGTAAANAAGSHLLQPGEAAVWFGTFAPSNALSIIGATTSQPFTAEEG